MDILKAFRINPQLLLTPRNCLSVSIIGITLVIAGCMYILVKLAAVEDMSTQKIPKVIQKVKEQINDAAEERRVFTKAVNAKFERMLEVVREQGDFIRDHVRQMEEQTQPPLSPNSTLNQAEEMVKRLLVQNADEAEKTAEEA